MMRKICVLTLKCKLNSKKKTIGLEINPQAQRKNNVLTLKCKDKSKDELNSQNNILAKKEKNLSLSCK